MSATAPRQRRSTNLTIDPTLVSQGKAAGLNLSKIAENAIRDELRRVQGEQWVKDNEKAIAAHNERVEKRGMFNDDLRQF